VDENGTVACRGKGDDGQTADVERRDWVEHPVRIRGLDRARQVVVGRRHACALLEDDSVRCWGNDLRGQLGKGTGPGARGPVTVPGLANVAHVSAGFETACAVLADGTVRCWGSNAQGQIGDGTRVDRPTPTPVAGLTEATYVSIGSPRTCARRTDGTVWCWGDAQFVPPGDGGRSAASLPAPLPDLTGVAEIEMGSGGCARLDDGTLRCWGDCHERKPGSPRLTGVAEVAVGANVRCARRTDGSVHCWACDCEMATCGGEGTPYGPRRVATFLARRSPFARAPGVSSSLARQLSIDEGFGCALLVGGVAACWRNDLGSMPPQGMVTTDLLEVAGADLVAAGESLNCVRMAADGSVQCWGELRGDYGPGPVARDRLTPIDDLRGAAQLAAGEGFACARMPDGTVRCFGAWSRGQLGDGALGYSAVPVAVVW
jgi:alpha-tubulin suppressor-like RCC1 family protein